MEAKAYTREIEEERIQQQMLLPFLLVFAGEINAVVPWWNQPVYMA